MRRDFSNEKPASDETFRLCQGVYSYDRTPLNPVIEAAEESSEHWRKEKISFQAAYGNERGTACLFLPKNAVPPYLTVVRSPGGYAVHFPFPMTDAVKEILAWLDRCLGPARAK